MASTNVSVGRPSSPCFLVLRFSLCRISFAAESSVFQAHLDLRPSLIGWTILNLCYCHYQYAVSAAVDPSLLLITIFQAVYCWDALYQEEALLSTVDITTGRSAVRPFRHFPSTAPADDVPDSRTTIPPLHTFVLRKCAAAAASNSYVGAPLCFVAPWFLGGEKINDFFRQPVVMVSQLSSTRPTAHPHPSIKQRANAKSNGGVGRRGFSPGSDLIALFMSAPPRQST